jgi:hypothetical protein
MSMAICPKSARSKRQGGQPVRCAIPSRIVSKSGEEIGQIPFDEHCEFGARKHAPHRAGQAPSSGDFRDPTPTLVIDRKRKAGAKYGYRLLRIQAPGEVDAAEGRF